MCNFNDNHSARRKAEPRTAQEPDFASNIINFPGRAATHEPGGIDQEIVFRDALHLLADVAMLSFAWNQLIQGLIELEAQLTGISKLL